jgi:CTP synthase (UTP-ammonia lyase)
MRVEGATHITVVGDYDDRNATHRATSEELAAAGVEHEWLPTGAVGDPARSLAAADGVWISPSSPYADMEGALAAIRHARETGLPVLGTCGGFQHMLIELVRDVLGVADADHAETSPQAERLAIVPLACSLYGQQHAVTFDEGSRIRALYGRERSVEPYFCSFGLSPEYEPRLEAAGLRVTGRDDEGSARVMELDGHPFFLGTLFVFQAGDEHARPHPVTEGFLAAATAPALERA